MSDKTNYEAGFGSNALKEPRRIVFITKKTSAKVKGEVGPQLMSFPHVILREMMAFEILVIALVVIALFWDAPLEQLADRLLTPNPAKAPWYFLGLQELLHYFPPVVAGILIPTLVVVGFIVIPYFHVNIEGAPLWARDGARRFRIAVTVATGLAIVLVLFEAWTVVVPTVVMGALLVASYYAPRERGGIRAYLHARPLSWWVMTWFIVVAVTLTVVGTFFRGPGWSWVWFWR